MNARIVGTLVAKDFRLYFRNKPIAVLTLLGFLFYLLFYFLLPSSTDEVLRIGVYSSSSLPGLGRQESEGISIVGFESDEAIREAVIQGQILAALSLVDISAQAPRARLYFAVGTPEETKNLVAVALREAILERTGQAAPIQMTETIIGPDMLGRQVAPRDRLRPMLAIFLLCVETLGLAILIGEEIERRTIRALLVTPATVSHLFAAKGLVGTSMAFGQALLFMAIVGGLNREPLSVLVALLLGAILVTGIAFLIGSAARDMQSAMPWLVVALVPMLIPTFGVLFPGSLTSWVKVIPSYYLVDAVHRSASFGSGLGDVWQSLLILLAFDVLVASAGVAVLNRRLR